MISRVSPYGAFYNSCSCYGLSINFPDWIIWYCTEACFYLSLISFEGVTGHGLSLIQEDKVSFGIVIINIIVTTHGLGGKRKNNCYEFLSIVNDKGQGTYQVHLEPVYHSSTLEKGQIKLNSSGLSFLLCLSSTQKFLT